MASKSQKKHQQQQKTQPVDAVAVAISAMDVSEVPQGQQQSQQLQQQQQPLLPPTYQPNRFLHATLAENPGAIVQVISNNCNDNSTIIGAFRIPVSDSHSIAKYLDVHEEEIKKIGVHYLLEHMRNSACHIGVLEDTIPLSDYSHGFMVASVTEAAARLHPGGRREGGMWKLMFPSLLELQRINMFEGGEFNTDTWTYVVNMYIHLNEPNRRGRTVVAKAEQEQLEEERKEAEKRAELEAREARRRAKEEAAQQAIDQAEDRRQPPAKMGRGNGKVVFQNDAFPRHRSKSDDRRRQTAQPRNDQAPVNVAPAQVPAPAAPQPMPMMSYAPVQVMTPTPIQNPTPMPPAPLPVTVPTQIPVPTPVPAPVENFTPRAPTLKEVADLIMDAPATPTVRFNTNPTVPAPRQPMTSSWANQTNAPPQA